MSFKKANYKFGQRVRVIDPYYGLIGTITGIARINWYDTYIITLDEPYDAGTEVMPIFQTVTANEMQLEPIKDKE
jgi:hypothetical protein